MLQSNHWGKHELTSTQTVQLLPKHNPQDQQALADLAPSISKGHRFWGLETQNCSLGQFKTCGDSEYTISFWHHDSSSSWLMISKKGKTFRFQLVALCVNKIYIYIYFFDLYVIYIYLFICSIRIWICVNPSYCLSVRKFKGATSLPFPQPRQSWWRTSPIALALARLRQDHEPRPAVETHERDGEMENTKVSQYKVRVGMLKSLLLRHLWVHETNLLGGLVSNLFGGCPQK